MTANIHEGERIIPAADNRELIARLRAPDAGNAVLVAEIRRLNAVVEAGNVAIAKNTSVTAKTLRQWDGDGMPDVRDLTS